MTRNMAIAKKYGKAALRTAFLLFFISSFFSLAVFAVNDKVVSQSGKTSVKKVNTFKNPDFAFPKTVESNAQTVLNNSLKTGNDLEAIKSALQIAVARNLVSKDNYIQSIEMFDSLAKKLREPYSSLTRLLEAQVYKEIYQSKPWIFNNRTLPLQPLPENVMEWNKEMFRLRISELVADCFKETGQAKAMPIERLSGLITDISDARRLDMSVYDFIIIRSIELMKPFVSSGADGERIIPFGNLSDNEIGKDIENTVMSLLNKGIEWNLSINKKELAAAYEYIKYQNLPYSEKRDFLKTCVESYISTPFCAPFLYAEKSFISDAESLQNGYVISSSKKIIKENQKTKQYYAKVSDYLKKYPKCENAEVLNTTLSSLSAKTISVNSPDQLLPGRASCIKVSASNIFHFNLLVVKLPDSFSKNNIRIRDILSQGRVCGVIPVKETGTIPERFEKDYEIPALSSGRYVIVPSSGTTIAGVIKGVSSNQYLDVFSVSSISYFRLSGKGNKQSRLFVVSGFDQAPVENAKVVFKPSNNKTASITRFSGSDGSVEIPDGYYEITITKGNDIVRGEIWNNGNRVDSDPINLKGKILTDLSIYKPGDKVGFMGILYGGKQREYVAKENTEIKIELVDANYQVVDSCRIVSDKYGKVNGSFTIPKSGLLGNYCLRLRHGKNILWNSYFAVAEYKSPTFYVNITGTEGMNYEVGDTVKIKGTVLTYSGMPVGGANVKFDVKYVPIWWFEHVLNASYGGEVISDSHGSFEIVLPTERIKDTPFSLGSFRINVSATNPAGETQEATPLSFSLGAAYYINASIPSKICLDQGEMSYSVKVMDILGNPVKKEVFYKIFACDENGEADMDKVIEKGSFFSPSFKIVSDNLKSGRYKFIFSLNNEFINTKDFRDAVSDVVIYRKTDLTPPYKTALWIPEEEIIATPEKSKIKIRFGSSYPEDWIYVRVNNCDSEISDKWIRIKDNMSEIEVESPQPNNRIFVTFAGMHDLNSVVGKVTVIPSAQRENIKISASSFRDKITPGTVEKWIFNFTFKDNNLAGIPVAAVMSNKALNALNPFAWNFNPKGEISYNSFGGINYPYINQMSWLLRLNTVNYKALNLPSTPEWDLYGYSLYGGFNKTVRYKAMRSMNTSAGATVELYDVVDQVAEAPMMAAANMAVKADGNDMAVLDETEEVTVDGFSGSKQEKQEVREIECPLAFFMPNLVTDSSGNAVVDFTVPQFNGTWQFQIMGYTSDMLGGVKTLDAIASKPVMASLNAPRFLRTGDLTLIAATIYNSSDKASSIGGRLEIFEPETGKIISVMNFPEELVMASGSRIVSMQYAPENNVNYIGIRIFGYNSDFSDGEQTIIPVLPSSTPVIESSTFYIEAGKERFEMKLPTFGKDANTVLQYCDNPVWEVVTALPDISEPKSSNVLSLIYSLYGNAIGAGIVKEYPEIKEALLIFSSKKNSSDSTLVSNLEKNSELKTIALNNTPWVRSAASETLRMQNLVLYSDTARSEQIISSTLNSIGKLQNPDGGWSWCAGMKSSGFITARVLLHFGMLNSMGYLTPEAVKMAENGIGYADASWVKDLKEYKNRGKDYPYIRMLNYLYVRGMFNKTVSSGEFLNMSKRAVEAVRQGWKEMGIYDKATAAMMLDKAGFKEDARTILESLKQYASFSEDKGMWFDNLSSSFGGWNKLITTAQVLEAYSAVSPESPEIDKLRQWLVITKQAENWGDDRETAEVIQAILSSGTKWTVPSSPVKVSVGGKDIDISNLAAITGSMTVNLNSTRKGMLKIERSGRGPAWGGIISQYVAPIKDIKSASVPELSVEKRFYAITEGDQGTKASVSHFRIGDKIRVTLTFNCDRDIEYVAVADERPACFEPSDQISRYMVSDGIWLYREIRNEGVNLFIPFLPKGTHVISYDCYADRAGEYSAGIATAQSQYAPTITAHSAGEIITVSQGE